MFKTDLIENQNFLIIIVDAQIEQSQYLAQILSANDYRVICVTDGLRAIELMTSGAVPDILITDLKTPTLNGFELVEKIQQLELHVPTIIMSGSNDNSDFEEAFILGARGYLVKPFSPTQLLVRLEKILWDHHIDQRLKINRLILSRLMPM